MPGVNILRANRDFSLIIFGASGHLAKLRLFPALYFMALKRRLPERFSIVGYARSEMDDAGFRSHVADAVREHVEAVNEGVLNGLLGHAHYHRGQYDDAADFGALNARLEDLEKAGGMVRHIRPIRQAQGRQAQGRQAQCKPGSPPKAPVRVAYFSVPPTMFGVVAKNLCAGGIHQRGPDRSNFRCIIEKPLGRDYASAREIQQCLTECFGEDEIYLLDHYLGKEAARNIYYLRLVNPIVERILKHTLVMNVQITASEAAGLEGRAGYFEQVGTLRDMFQSHMTELMALLTMPLVEREKLPQARLDAMRNIYLPPAAHLSEIVLQGQYVAGEGHRGYREEEGVAADSRTPTFVAMKLMTRVERWQGTPFYLRSGKRLSGKETRIAFEFRNPYAVTGDIAPNRLEIILQGEGGMRVHLRTKMGGSEPQFRPLVLEDPLVCVGDCMDEHGLLLLEAVNGKRDWFLDFEEAMAGWKLIDPLQAYLEKPDTPLHPYPSGSGGPKEAVEWLEREGYEWI